MEATRSSETSVLTRATRRHISEDGILRKLIVFWQLLRARTHAVMAIDLIMLRMRRPVDSGLLACFSARAVASNPKRVMNVFMCVYPACVVLRVGRGLATG
jgi:hypothetical protein